MPRLPRISSKTISRALERAGFYVHHQKGSHRHYRHPTNPSIRIVLPTGKKDMRPGTLLSILKQAKLSVDDLIRLMDE